MAQRLSHMRRADWLRIVPTIWAVVTPSMRVSDLTIGRPPLAFLVRILPPWMSRISLQSPPPSRSSVKRDLADSSSLAVLWSCSMRPASRKPAPPPPPRDDEATDDGRRERRLDEMLPAPMPMPESASPRTDLARPACCSDGSTPAMAGAPCFWR